MTGTYFPLTSETLIITGLWLSALASRAYNDQSQVSPSLLGLLTRSAPSFGQVLIWVIKLLEEKSPHLSNSRASDLGALISPGMMIMIMLWALYICITLSLSLLSECAGIADCPGHYYWGEDWCQYQGWWAGVLLNITNDVPGWCDHDHQWSLRSIVMILGIILASSPTVHCPLPQPGLPPRSQLNMQHI